MGKALVFNKQVMAVLTGDIVRSSSLNSARRFELYEGLQQLSALLRARYPREVPFEMAKYRGDGWQLAVSEPEKAFEISLFIRTWLRFQFGAEKLDTRVAIAVGRVDFVPQDNLSEGYGPAFSDSGKLLDGLKEQRMGFILSDKGGVFSLMTAQMIKAYDALISAWTPAQCQAVFLALHSLTQAEIGSRWQPAPITQAAVAKHLKSANWELIKEGLSVFREAAGEFNSPAKGGR